MNRKNKFPLDHVLKEDTKEVWVRCDSSVTAIGLPSLVNQYYPGYTAKIATEEYFNKLKGQLQN